MVPAVSEALRELAGAYAGVEEMSSFADRDALESYRESVLVRTRPQADFLAAQLPPSARVLEVACGNGRLLVELAQRGALAAGVGLDVAASRVEFAARWATDRGLGALAFDTGDVLADPLPGGGYDAVTCITGAFGYFEPAAPGSATVLAARMHGALAPGGLLCLELYPSPRYRHLAEASGGEVRVWSELPAEDPWRFYLSHVRVDGPVLEHRKTFIHRRTGEVDAGRCERLYLYTPRSIAELLGEAGFEDPRAHEGWTSAPYAGGESMVVTARRGPR
jgi:SAM-dependent methyltransferase